MAELKLCRICLQKDVKMFNLDQYKLKMYYEEIVPDTSLNENSIPNYACYECAALLQKYHKFRHKCLQARQLLEEALWKGSINEESIKSINRYKHNLASSLVIKTFINTNYSYNNDEVKVESFYCENNDNFENEVDHDDFEIKNDQDDDDRRVDEMSLDEEALPLAVFVKLDKDSKEQRKKHKKKDADVLDTQHWFIKHFNEEEALINFKNLAQGDYYNRAEHKCEECLKGFKTKDMYERHRRKMHWPENEHACSFCHMRFAQLNQASKHTLCHYSSFQCLRCPNRPVFGRLQSAVLHDDVHTDKKKKCAECGIEFKHSSTLYTHLRLQHRSRHLCTICGVSCVSALGLKCHKKRAHVKGCENTSLADDSAPAHCATCDVTFESRMAYDEHFAHSKLHYTPVEDCKRRAPMRTRKPRTPTTCPKCGLSFSSTLACVRHHRLQHPRSPFHTKQQRLICEICGASLAPGSVNAHLNSHRRLRMHACAACGRQFTQSSTLKRHMLIHTGEKPFPCAECGKSFTQSNSLKLHHRTVHLKQPHPKRNRKKKILTASSEKMDPITK